MTLLGRLAALVVAATLLPLTAGGAQELVYRFDPELGVPYKGSATSQMRTQTTFQGMDLDMTMTYGMEQDVVFEAGAEDDTVVGQYTITSVSAEIGGMPGIDQMPFDLNDLYQAMVGQGFTTVVARNGAVLDFSGFEGLMDAMMDRVELPEEMKQAMRQGLESNLGGGQFKDMVQQGVPHMPTEPIDTGATWTDSVTAFGLTVDTTYTLGERGDGAASIEVAADLSGSDEAGFGLPGMPEIPGFEMHYENLSGDYTGTYELDEATGLAVSYSLDMTMNVDMSMEMPQVEGQPPAASSMSMSVSMQTTVEGELRRAE